MSGGVNIGSGQAVAVRELIAEAAGLAAQPTALRFGERLLSANEPARLVAAIERLRDEVGFVPRYSLRAGLINTLAASGLRLKPQ